MQYSVVHFSFSFAEEWQGDVFAQALFDMGFDTIDGSDAYVPAALLDEGRLRALAAETEGVEIAGIEACPDANWNAAWESEHEPMDLPLGVKIVPHCAFGAGHHETTGMLIDALLAHDMRGKCVLDNGCGTGVLGIMAAKLGARRVVAVDIDDKSVENTRENAALNGVSVEVHLGSEPVAVEGKYDLILSNIHRNLLLSQMPTYARLGKEVWLSGFYETDAPALLSAAEQSGLRLTEKKTRNTWCSLLLTSH